MSRTNANFVIKPKIIVVSGTNASGKSGIGIALAARFNGEIISADSRQLYRGFDLCSGKVTARERAVVTHHMLDVIDVGETFSVADYQKRTYALIDDIIARGKTPFIVGGTGLYINAVTKGYELAEEPGDPAYRLTLDTLSIEQLREMLSPAGREYLAGNPSDWGNRRRIVRVLEKERLGSPLAPQKTSKFEVLQLGVTWEKEELARRIDERLDMRMRQGMPREVEEYLKNGGEARHLENLGLEYKYLLHLVQGEYLNIEDLKIELSRAIKQFARRQQSWFKRDPDIVWLDMNGDYLGQASELSARFLGANNQSDRA